MDGGIEEIKTSRSVAKISSTAQRLIPEHPSGFTNAAIAENLLSLLESKKRGRKRRELLERSWHHDVPHAFLIRWEKPPFTDEQHILQSLASTPAACHPPCTEHRCGGDMRLESLARHDDLTWTCGNAPLTPARWHQDLSNFQLPDSLCRCFWLPMAAVS